jgi:hypothetical protein
MCVSRTGEILACAGGDELSITGGGDFAGVGKDDEGSGADAGGPLVTLFGFAADGGAV